MPERTDIPQCPWEVPLTAICPKHGGPVVDCPVTVFTWPTLALDRVAPGATGQESA